MKSIQTPFFYKEKKHFFFLLILCSLAFTNVAFGGTNLIRFKWLPGFHAWSNANSPSSAALEAELIVYPDGLAPENDFYLTATTPHSLLGGEIVVRHYGDSLTYFGLEEGAGSIFTPLDADTMKPFIGTRVVSGVTVSVLRYRLSNRRTLGSKTELACTNFRARIAGPSDDAPLPQSTINVERDPSFLPHAFPSSGGIQIVTSSGAQSIRYTGTTTQNGMTTSFTGCTGGTGLLAAGNPVAQLSGNKTTATHFHNTIELFDYDNQQWLEWYDHEFDHTALLHDCTACDGVCGDWGVMFESSPIYFPGPPPSYGGCALGFLPPIGVLDVLVSINDGPFVPGSAANSTYEEILNGCNPSQNAPYQLFLPTIENRQWIIRSVPSDE